MLIKCKECGGLVSKKAVACPKCGAKQSQLNMVLLAMVLGGIAVALAAGKTVAGNEPDEAPAAPHAAVPVAPAAGDNKEIKDFMQATEDAGVKSGGSH